MTARDIAAETTTPSRYVVGIDLGTTNSAVAFIDTESPALAVETLHIPQVVAPGTIEARDTLPSFHYEAAPGEFPPAAFRLPWDAKPREYAVGAFARDHGARVPGRLVVSAKSWLCHSGVDRTANLLPWHGAADVARLSPVEVSGRYLLQIREAWDHRHREHPLAAQDVVLTLPASFDEVARDLTVKAAQRAGLARVVLVEEPQAAFYDWIQLHRDDWQSRVRPGQKILVCDIGGGTTDFTLIRVRQSSQGEPQLHRVAVGEHLILGGDNLDLALAHYVEEKMLGAGNKLPPQSWSVLVRNCRVVKETLLGDQPPQTYTVAVAGSGSRLIGGSKQVEVTRDEVERVLADGFLPRVALDDKPAARRSGFQEFGLPYAPDAAMTRYLAQFLVTHRHAGDAPDEPKVAHDPARPDIVLFNGGFFESPLLRSRLLSVLASWFDAGDAQPPWQPEVFHNPRLDLAVAHGAAYYGLVRRGLGVRIASPLARTYYIGVAQSPDRAPAAICLLPAGVEEGHKVDLAEQPLDLLIRQPVEFPLYVSSTRLTDRPGALVPIDREQMTPLPPIRTALAARKADDADRVRVHLLAGLTEIGTLELSCAEVAGPRKWKLQFDIRSTTRTDLVAHAGRGEREGFVDESTLDLCRQHVRRIFLPSSTGNVQNSGSLSDRPEDLISTLEEIIGSSRQKWPSSLLRELWGATFECEPGRHRSANHEQRWLNLLGFALRPGYGFAVDDWRVAQTWKLFQGKRVMHAVTACRIEYLILWRRIAGGLAAGQQLALAEPLLAMIRPLFKQAAKEGKPKTASQRKDGKAKSSAGVFGFGPHETAEAWRLVGSLELLPQPLKIDLGRLLLRLLTREEASAVRTASLWAISRIGARQPLYGPLNNVLPAEVVEGWIDDLLNQAPGDDIVPLALMQLARKTGDRYRDIAAQTRSSVLAWLNRHQAPHRLQALVRDGGELDAEEAGQVFGDSLPQGLWMST